MEITVGVLVICVLVAAAAAFYFAAQAKSVRDVQPADGGNLGKYVTAARVPARLQQLFHTQYGGPNRKYDEEIDVCFRNEAFHKVHEYPEYPIDARITIHRDAYLYDPTIAVALAAIIKTLEAHGMHFVALYGRHFATTCTPSFETYLQAGGVEHGAWTPVIANETGEVTLKKGGGKRSATGEWLPGGAYVAVDD